MVWIESAGALPGATAISEALGLRMNDAGDCGVGVGVGLGMGVGGGPPPVDPPPPQPWAQASRAAKAKTNHLDLGMVRLTPCA